MNDLTHQPEYCLNYENIAWSKFDIFKLFIIFKNDNKKDVEKQRLIESSDTQCEENNFAVLYVFRLQSFQLYLRAGKRFLSLFSFSSSVQLKRERE